MRRDIPIAHRHSPFDFTAEEWAATHELLREANCFPEPGQPQLHAHLHVILRFDDEPFADQGGRSTIKVAENRRPDPSRRGSGRAQAFGRPG
jgi:hypothetical protein